MHKSSPTHYQTAPEAESMGLRHWRWGGRRAAKGKSRKRAWGWGYAAGGASTKGVGLGCG